MERLVGEPPVERLIATIARWHGILRAALLLAFRTSEADVEMIIVPPIGTYLRHPRLAFGDLAQGLLDRGVDENAFDVRLLGCRLDYAGLPRGPVIRIDRKTVVGHHVDGGHFLALLPRQATIGHRRQPDVGIKADLM